MVEMRLPTKANDGKSLHHQRWEIYLSLNLISCNLKILPGYQFLFYEVQLLLVRTKCLKFERNYGYMNMVFIFETIFILLGLYNSRNFSDGPEMNICTNIVPSFYSALLIICFIEQISCKYWAHGNENYLIK